MSGHYRLGAYHDLNRDLKYQANEPFLRAGPGLPFTCRSGDLHRGIALRIPPTGAVGQCVDAGCRAYVEEFFGGPLDCDE